MATKHREEFRVEAVRAALISALTLTQVVADLRTGHSMFKKSI